MSPSRGSRLLPAAGWLGFVCHLAMGLWYAASGLVAPWWAVVGLLLVWAAMTVVAWRLVRGRTPAWTLAVPVLDAVVWYAVVTAGDAWLGWTA